MIQVSAANNSSSAPLTSPLISEAFDFSFIHSSLNHDIIIDVSPGEGGRGVIDEDGEEEFFTPPVTPVFPRPVIRRPITVNPVPRPRPSNRSEHPGRQRTVTSTVVTTDDSQQQNVTRCDLLTTSSSSSSVNVNSSSTSPPSVSVSARPQNSQDSAHHVNQVEANHHHHQSSSVRNSENNTPSETTNEQATPHQTDLDSESNSHYEHVFLSSSQFSPATVVMPDTVSNTCYYRYLC